MVILGALDKKKLKERNELIEKGKILPNLKEQENYTTLLLEYIKDVITFYPNYNSTSQNFFTLKESFFHVYIKYLKNQTIEYIEELNVILSQFLERKPFYLYEVDEKLDTYFRNSVIIIRNIFSEKLEREKVMA